MIGNILLNIGNFAMLTSIAVWDTACLVLFYCLCFIFSTNIIPAQLQRKTNTKTVIFLLAGTTIAALLLPAFIFKICGMINENHGAWGCDIEYFLLFSIILLISLQFPFSVIMSIICLLKTRKFGIKKRWYIIIAFLIQNIYSIILLLIMEKNIRIIASSLNGINSSCM